MYELFSVYSVFTQKNTQNTLDVAKTILVITNHHYFVVCILCMEIGISDNPFFLLI